VTDAMRAEDALRASEERLKLAVEAGRMGTWDLDVKRNAVRYSQRLAYMLGLPEQEMSVDLAALFERVHHDDCAAVEAMFTAALPGEVEHRAEFRVDAAVGGERWLHSQGIVRLDERGAPVRMVGVVQDITARKQAEARQKLLLGELNHRVNNTLVTVLSIAMQMAREAGAPKQFYSAFKARILALSRAHDLLSRHGWRGASLHDLIEQMLAPHIAGGRISIHGPEVRLNPNATMGLAMAFNELATNALKHGALAASDGQIAITWTAEWSNGTGAVELSWVERGGPVVQRPDRRGFGSRLIEDGLAHELDAEIRLAFTPAGVECRIRLPLTHKVELA
jgi:PAS domain S-box-containing protein